MILTVTIEQAINLDGAEVTQLELNGAIVEELTRRNFQRQINGRLWRVTQLRYAIYPQQRGTLEIPSLSLTAREVLPGRSLLGARLGKRFILSEDAIEVNVKPVPAEFPGDVWLPAASLELAQSWSTPPESMEIGDSTTRTLTLAAEGLLSSQLPSITSMSDSSKITGIRVYPDQESSDQIERTEGFLGQRTRSEALVASGSGSWTLPEVRVLGGTLKPIHFSLPFCLRRPLPWVAPWSKAQSSPLPWQPRRKPQQHRYGSTPWRVLVGFWHCYLPTCCGAHVNAKRVMSRQTILRKPCDRC